MAFNFVWRLFHDSLTDYDYETRQTRSPRIQLQFNSPLFGMIAMKPELTLCMTLPLLSPSWNPETLNKHGGDDGNRRDATYKVHSRSASKLHVDYSRLLSLSNEARKFLGVESLSRNSKFRMRKTCQFLVVCLRPPQNVFSGSLTPWPSSDGKEMYLKVWCTSTVFGVLIAVTLIV